jgi:hypothetical protein
MPDEIREKLLTILNEVDALKAKDGALQAEKQRHIDQIQQSENDLKRTNDDLEECRENSLRLKRQMDDLKNELFARPEDAEEVIIEDNAHMPTDGSETQKDNTAEKMWDARVKHLKQV